MRNGVAGFVTLFIAGCGHVTAPSIPSARQSVAPAMVQPFSTRTAGESVPAPWEPWLISRFLARTEYSIVEHDGESVLAANANMSLSGLLQPVTVAPTEYPYLSWRWKVPQLIPNADNASRLADDAAVRIVVAFDGDKSKFDFEDRALAQLVKLFSGREMPYATIQYIWENRLPAETVLDNNRTARSKMLVVESGPQHVGKWLAFRRNVKADFERMFGEPPGKIIYVGVMTDTNATASKATAYYGDIRFSPQ